MNLATTALRPRTDRAFTGQSSRFARFYLVVVLVQGLHVIEHIVQLLQVTVFDVPSDEAFGVLGYLVQFNGTAEWLHLVYNVLFLASLYVLAVGLLRRTSEGRVPLWMFRAFVIGAVGLETWHMTEHVVIIWHVIHNHGCPCPGIGDQVLNVTDIQLHFAYNVITYAAALVPLRVVWRDRR